MVAHNIELSNAELITCANMGVMRRISALNKDRQPQYGIKGSSEWQADITGAIGEYVLSKALNICWSPAIGELDKHTGDVNGYQVRATEHTNGHLILGDRDKNDDVFVLITGNNRVAKHWTVRGWCYGREAKQKEYWKDMGNNGRPAFFYPQKELRDIAELLSGYIHKN